MFRTHQLARVRSTQAFDGDAEPTLEDLLKREDVTKTLEDRIKAAVDKATTGLIQNRDAILGEKKTLADQLKALEGKVEGLDLDNVRDILKRIENDEEASLIKDGKIDEVVNRRVEKAVIEARKDAETYRKKLEDISGQLSGKDATIHKLVVESDLRRVASKLGIADTAVEDFIARGTGVFSAHQTEDGKFVAVQLDKDGSPVRGKDGKSPFMPEEWGETLREAAPHFWPPSGGGGAHGSGSGDRGDGKPDLEKMSPKDKLAFGFQTT